MWLKINIKHTYIGNCVLWAAVLLLMMGLFSKYQSLCYRGLDGSYYQFLNKELSASIMPFIDLSCSHTQAQVRYFSSPFTVRSQFGGTC